MMRITFFAVLLLSALGLAGPSAAQAELTEAERAADCFVGMFFDRPARAAAATTRDPDDDARVDHWLRRCAMLAGGRPPVQAALYRRLIYRALARRDGEQAALRHLLAFAKVQPRHRWCRPDAMAQAYRLAYQAAGRSERTALAEPFIEVLLPVAQRHERAWEIEAALTAQREALSVARSARSPYRDVLEDYGRSLATLQRAAQQLDATREQAPRDPAAARALAVRLAAERSDLEGAADAAQAAGDAQLQSLLLLAAQPVLEIEPMQALAVAEMFRALADDPALALDCGKLQALQEAHFYYHHFLFAYPTRDVVRLTAVETAAQLTPRIDGLRPTPLRRPAGPWRSLVNNITEPRVGDRGNLVHGRHLRVRNNTVYANSSAFTIPVELDESYDFRMGITLTHANDRSGMSLYFPIGENRGGRLVLGQSGDESCMIDGLEPIERLAGFRFPEDRPVGMVLAVRRVGGGNVHLTLTLDGTEVLDWAGPIRQLHVGNNQRPPPRHGNIFRVGAGTSYEFQQIEVRRAAEE